MENKEVIEHLKSLQRHCKDMLTPDASDVWAEDVEALEIAIERLRGDQGPIRWEELDRLLGAKIWDSVHKAFVTMQGYERFISGLMSIIFLVIRMSSGLIGWRIDTTGRNRKYRLSNPEVLQCRLNSLYAHICNGKEVTD